MIRCGHCQGRHTSVSDVRECADREAEAAWEAQLERDAERFWEEGPNGPADDPRERALWALEAEARALVSRPWSWGND